MFQRPLLPEADVPGNRSVRPALGRSRHRTNSSYPHVLAPNPIFTYRPIAATDGPQIDQRTHEERKAVSFQCGLPFVETSRKKGLGLPWGGCTSAAGALLGSLQRLLLGEPDLAFLMVAPSIMSAQS